MSVENRKIKPGESATVKYESKWRTFLGKIACLFRGHKPVMLLGNRYCISCWKRMNERIKQDQVTEWLEDDGKL